MGEFAPLTRTLSHEVRENYNDLPGYLQLYILVTVMGIALYVGSASVDIIRMQ